MEPVTMVAAALAAGAAAGLTDTAEQAVADAYAAVKSLVARRYRSVDVDVVERQPQSQQGRTELAEQLSRAGAGGDAELLAAARQLLVVIHRDAPEVADAVGVRLSEIHAGELEIEDVASSGSGVVAENATVDGAFRIKGVRAGVSGPPDPLEARR